MRQATSVLVAYRAMIPRGNEFGITHEPKLYYQGSRTMNGEPFVSVIMNCYNSGKYLQESIESVFSQTYRNWEIIFWDNASTDDSKKIAHDFPLPLKYYRCDRNVPLGEARNYALEKASGEFIAFLDCDDLWMPQKLEKQIPLFNDPEVGLVYSDAIYFNEEGDNHRLYQSRPYYTGRCFTQLLTDYFLCLQTVVIRRSTLDSLAYWFDTAFNMNEEADLFTRIGYHSWKLEMVDEPLAKWRVHSSSLTWKSGVQFLDEIGAMLEKYENMIPDFSTEYAREIRILQKRYGISKAMFLWRADNNREARRSLLPLLKHSIKAWFVFGATYFPQRLMRRLITPFRKTKISPKSNGS